MTIKRIQVKETTRVTELCGRIETLERELEYQKEYAMEQSERYG